MEKKDANDYSRFDDVDTSDDESAPETTSSAEEVLSVSEAIYRANGLKEIGNTNFKGGNLTLAKSSYQEAIGIIKRTKDSKDFESTEEQRVEISSILTSLHGNLAMLYLKDEDWSQAISNATSVLQIDSVNVKALFRRGVAYSRTGKFEDSKFDLTKCLELDSTNTAARKELVELSKAIKEQQKKDKAMYSSLFSKGSMYDDRERERLAKQKREQEEAERMRDEWSKSKLDRRDRGLPEQTFEEWKKELEDKKKADSSPDTSKKASTASTTKKTKLKKPEEVNEDDYDEEEAKIISETKSKGYCYFRNQQSTEVKALIGDISPKAVSTPSSEEADLVANPTGAADEGASTSGSISASSWNHAGTWEERDLSLIAKDRLKELLLQSRAELAPVDLTQPSALSELTASLQSISASLSEPSAALDGLSANMATLRASVTNAKTVEGEAQVIIARGKKRHLFDFNVSLEFEVDIDDKGPEAVVPDKKMKKIKGTISIPEVSPTMPLEPSLRFNKALPLRFEKRIKEVGDLLKNAVVAKVKEFETEYTTM